ncbi:hypothetical protein EV138_3419 [Kribbella voronezhensis]|uniref:SnoaL-like domain-containing protein n=1 Tax=Kribbella voronezhensis TaxID=2512212 RepID=A0A4R7TCK9_9ACTN|nr:nuclear transport factor 2 family protein [Kribbella voronezhensis]TDU89842.1 hypothetical protein EV138_3419 [Kribbella voronezhensis]
MTTTPGSSGAAQSSDTDVMAAMNRFYAAEAAYVAAGGSAAGADFTAVAACLDPDVVLYQAPGLPFTGTGEWRGHRGIQTFQDLFAETWQSMDVVQARVVADTSTVVMLLQVRFRARATGGTIETRIVQVNEIANGRIAEFRPYYWDPAAIVEVCAAS